jgi:hypothetical protein
MHNREWQENKYIKQRVSRKQTHKTKSDKKTKYIKQTATRQQTDKTQSEKTINA